ncbi:MAG: DMT family transporter [Alphaproteobacteria bacterium]|nr:DMT family transporter [Alphaproteobacteria bacterium]
MNTPSLAFYIALSTVGGILIPIMAALSGGLGRTIDSPWMAAAIVSGGGFALTLAFALLNGGANISWEALQQAKPAQLLAGAGFAFYLLSITWVGPRFGIGNAVMFVLAGQIISSALIDHFGLFGAPQKPIDLLRASGLVIMAVGIAIAQIAANNARPQA